MMRFAAAALFSLAACGSAAADDRTMYPPVASTSSGAVVLAAKDGVKIFGTFYRAANPPKATILLFHQAGSGKGEYARIAPRLAAAEYDALAIDQRSGGNLYGENQTVAALGRSADYLSAQADLQAAVDWARIRNRPVILWGSSYSSSLVFLIAAKNPRIAAVIAFSPGEYFDDKRLVARAAAKLAVPVYLTSASDAGEIAAAGAIARAVPGQRATQYVPQVGIHGSSTLIFARNQKGAEANWQAVLAFLGKVAP